MFSQLTTSPTAAPEIWAAIAATATAAALVAKKLLTRKKSGPTPEYISRIEFHQELSDLRTDLGTKIDVRHEDLLSTIADQGDKFEHRLDNLETMVARIDERTATAICPLRGARNQQVVITDEALRKAEAGIRLL